MVSEQRSYKRLDVKGSVHLKSEEEEPRIFRAYLDDVGFGGFKMYAQQRIEVGKDVEFELITPLLNKPLPGRGQIRHVRRIVTEATPLFAMGVEFSEVNKGKTIQLIKRVLGWDKKPMTVRRRNRELSLFLKALPLIIVITWGALKVIDGVSGSSDAEQRYTAKLKDAAVYYLYNGH